MTIQVIKPSNIKPVKAPLVFLFFVFNE